MKTEQPIATAEITDLERAEHIMDTWQNHDDIGDGGPCNYCEARYGADCAPTKKFGDYWHEKDCPVFAADNLLHEAEK